jgi:hypothetical protein
MAGWSSRRRLRTGSAGCMSFATTGRSRPRRPTPRPHLRRRRPHLRRRRPGPFRVHPPIDSPGPADRQRRRRALTDRRRGMTRGSLLRRPARRVGRRWSGAPTRCGRDCRRCSRGPRRPRRHRVRLRPPASRDAPGRARRSVPRALGRCRSAGRRRTRGGARSGCRSRCRRISRGPTSRGLTGRRRTGRCRIRPGRRRIATRRLPPGRAVEWPAREKRGEAAG